MNTPNIHLQKDIIRIASQINGLDHFGIISALTQQYKEWNQFSNWYLLDAINANLQNGWLGNGSGNSLYATTAGKSIL